MDEHTNDDRLAHGGTPRPGRRGWMFRPAPPSTPLTPRISQATGMVCAQVTCTPLAALMLMEARASEQGRPLADIALDVVDRAIRFAD